MSEEEKEVLKTFKSGLGLTSVEQEILLNYIEKLQKENQEYHRIKKELIRVNKKIYDVDTIDEFIETIDKQQKVIDLMADYTCDYDVNDYTGENLWKNIEEVKEYFYKKAEE